MIWILIALLDVAAWALWFILQWNIVIPIVVTAVLGLFALVLFIWRSVKARRSAGALERAIAEQGKQQAMNARPERRAEIQALQKQILDGIQALKQSKLGGKKRGSGALYSLPWYAIIGPPGAGKTTALKHSGMVFPYADTSVRGVGGTRNCDWWFTNEAILLDTAGRYTTEQEDQQEWLAFLGMLSKHRSNKPLNGLLVAVSITDVMDANEQQLELMGKRIRARIDEVMTKLRMVLPVYLLITKCDLVAGFVEFFGDLKKSDRVQPWGATVALKEDKSKPGEIFQREFDLLVGEVFKRGVKRLAQERDRAARERIYQFPLEFAGIKRNLSDLIATMFMVNAFQGTPTFRGFYFTSGTQEGAPMARVLSRMGQAMGIRPPQLGARQQVESKSYFLHDVFVNIVFPDAAVAGRSSTELRRQRIVRLAVAITALAVAVLFAVPSILSFFKNKSYLEATLADCKTAAAITWRDAQSGQKTLDYVDDNLAAVQPLVKRLQELKDMNHSTPWGMGFLMYSGDKVYKPALRVFLQTFQKGFVLDAQEELGTVLARAQGKDNYVDERMALKIYLMLHQPEHLCGGDACAEEPSEDDVAWATGEFTERWFNARSSRAKDIGTLRDKMRAQVQFYLQLLGGKEAGAVEPQESLIKKARDALNSDTAPNRYYRLFVDILNRQKIDPKGDLTLGNLAFPPVTLLTCFDPTRQDTAKKWLQSKVNLAEQKKSGKESGKYYEVGGAYTLPGRVAVYSNFEDAKDILRRESWVVPLASDEEKRIDEVLRDVVARYEENYVEAWKGFLLDMQIAPPMSLEQAKALYLFLADSPQPLLEIVRRVDEHTQWKNPSENKGVQAVADKLGKGAAQRFQGVTSFKVNVDLNQLIKKGSSKIPGTFKKVVGLADVNGPLDQFKGMADGLRSKIAERVRDDPKTDIKDLDSEIKEKIRQASTLVQGTDEFTRMAFMPLLQSPFNIGGAFKVVDPAFASATK
ncbi:MAG: type VI secretion system membrane subunit TssM [Myxococcales bacterium]|nr:type VI secretion system membrane subunit TssM [Myxococcales bacterium]